MATGPANLIKTQIKSNLLSLVADTVLGAVIEKDINANILKEEITGYPCAILGSSSMEAQWEYQQSNRRTYIFPILIVQLQDNLISNTAIEDLRDAIALKFDNDVTLSGTAKLGVSAIMSERQVIADNGKTFVVFSVTIKASTIVDLTYNF